MPLNDVVLYGQQWLQDVYRLPHISILSFARSPCGGYVVFGTNFGTLLVYDLVPSFADERTYFELIPDEVIQLGHSHCIYALCTGLETLFCGSLGCLLVFKWCAQQDGSHKRILIKTDCVQLPIDLITREVVEISRMTFLSDSNLMVVACNNGDLHCFTLSPLLTLQSTIKAHCSPIHGLCAAGTFEYATCSEDGNLCFWDNRILKDQHCPQPCMSVKPSDVASLHRPHLGEWLTCVACQQGDFDWFTVGGGPRLSLWNRRALRHTSILSPPDNAWWYAQTCDFLNEDNPRIIAGGNTSDFFSWDHSGSLVYRSSLKQPAKHRISHVYLVSSFMDSAKHSLSAVRNSPLQHSVLVAGSGPAIQVVSLFGYSLGVLTYI